MCDQNGGAVDHEVRTQRESFNNSPQKGSNPNLNFKLCRCKSMPPYQNDPGTGWTVAINFLARLTGQAAAQAKHHGAAWGR